MEAKVTTSAPHALPGGYANVLGPDDSEQTAHAYGANTRRVLQLKRLFDPQGVFTSPISLPLQRAASRAIPFVQTGARIPFR